MLQPHAPCPPTWACPWPQGGAHSSPAVGTKLQTVLPLNERPWPLCCVFWGSREGWAGSFLLSGFGSTPSTHAFSCPFFCLFIYSPANSPIVHLHSHPSTYPTVSPPIHPPTHPSSCLFIHPSIHRAIHFPSTHLYISLSSIHLSTYSFIYIRPSRCSVSTYFALGAIPGPC